MTKEPNGQLNFNSLLIAVIGVLVTLYIHKADAAFTALIKLQDQQEYTIQRIANIESILGIYTPKIVKPPQQPQQVTQP